MSLVNKTIKDFVSGMVRVVERKVRHAERPKRWDNLVKEKMLIDPILSCITMYGLDGQIVYDPKAPVDFVWEALSFGWECKNFVDTKYVMKKWLEEHVLDRFLEQEKLIGKPIRHRALVVSEKRWEKNLDYWLATKGISVLEVGRVDSRLEVAQAMEVFMSWFEDTVWKICNGEVLVGG